MIDLSLDSKYDFQLCSSTNKNQLKIKFTISEYKPLIVRFATEKFNSIEENVNNGIKILFYTDKDNADNYWIPHKEDIKEAIQNLKILLKTQLGEVRENKKIGSELIRLKHKDIYSKEVLDEIKKITTEKVISIFENDNFIVDAYPQRNNEANYFYNQVIMVNIKSTIGNFEYNFSL